MSRADRALVGSAFDEALEDVTVSPAPSIRVPAARPRRTVRLLAAAIAAGAVLLGLAVALRGPAATGPVAGASGSTDLRIVAVGSGGGDQALLSGRLIAIEGCTYLEGPDGSATLIVWPRSFSVAPDADRSGDFAIHRADQTVAHRGEVIEASGGVVPDLPGVDLLGCGVYGQRIAVLNDDVSVVADRSAVRPTPPSGVGPEGDQQTVLETYATSHFPELYGGMSVHGTDRFEVGLTRLDPAVEAELRAVVPESRLTFARTLNSVRTLNRWTDQLQERWDSLRSRGIELVSFGPDTTTGKLSIGVEHLTAHDVETLADLFGAANIEVHDVSPESVDSVHLP